MTLPIKISSIADKGVLENERLILSVENATDIGRFALLQTGFNSETGEPSIRVHHAYWFPYKKVNAGDLVVLYTKNGTLNEKLIKESETRKAHFFYWSLEAAVWGAENRAVVLLHAPDWIHKRVAEL